MLPMSYEERLEHAFSFLHGTEDVLAAAREEALGGDYAAAAHHYDDAAAALTRCIRTLAGGEHQRQWQHVSVQAKGTPTAAPAAPSCNAASHAYPTTTCRS
jgi:hypothetical protein